MRHVDNKIFFERQHGSLQLPHLDRGRTPAKDLQDIAEIITQLSRTVGIPVVPPVQDQVYIDPNKTSLAFIEPYVPCSVRVLQDCFDPEAQLRQAVHWQDLGPLHGDVTVHPIPEFRSTAIGGAIAHYLGELARAGNRASLDSQEVVYSKLPTIFIGNAAPRTNEPQKTGAPFIYARLGFNIFYFGTNSDELGCLKPFLVGNPRKINIDECNTYRSRFLGKRVAEWRAGNTDNFGDELPSQLIPPAPRGAILFLDNFGNVKLNFTGRELENLVGPLKDLSPDKPVRLRIKFDNKEFLIAQVVRKLEDGKNGDLLLAVGSSRANLGREDLDNSVDCYLKGNADGCSAAGQFLQQLNIPVAPGTPKHLLPLPGHTVAIEKIRPPFSNLEIGILVSHLG
jgi:hypothetical protein